MKRLREVEWERWVSIAPNLSDLDLSIIIPSVVFVFSLFVSLIIRIPLWSMAFAATIPAIMLLTGEPFGESFTTKNAVAVFEFGWAAILAAVFGFALGNFLRKKKRMLRAISTGAAVLGALFVLASIYSPGWFHRVPLPSAAIGAILFFSVCLMCLALSLLRFVRAGITFGFWGFLLFVTALELSASGEIGEFFPPWLQDLHRRGYKHVEEYRASREYPEPRFRLRFIGGTQMIGGASPHGETLPDLTRKYLREARDGRPFVRVESNVGAGWGLSDLARATAELPPLQEGSSEVVVIGSWYADMIGEDTVSSGIRGNSRRQSPGNNTFLQLRKIPTIREYPIFLGLLESLNELLFESEESSERISNQEQYRNTFHDVLRTLKEQGRRPVVYIESVRPNSTSEPVALQMAQELQEVAAEAGVPLLSPNLPRKAFLSVNLMNAYGMKLVATEIANHLLSESEV